MSNTGLTATKSHDAKGKKIFVGGLTPSVKSKELRKHFEKYSDSANDQSKSVVKKAVVVMHKVLFDVKILGLDRCPKRKTIHSTVSQLVFQTL